MKSGTTARLTQLLQLQIFFHASVWNDWKVRLGDFCASSNSSDFNYGSKHKCLKEKTGCKKQDRPKLAVQETGQTKNSSARNRTDVPVSEFLRIIWQIEGQPSSDWATARNCCQISYGNQLQPETNKYGHQRKYLLTNMDEMYIIIVDR